VAETPTEAFPCNVTNFLEVKSDVAEFFVDYLTPLLLSSSGVISVIPDGIGNGESFDYNRVYLSRPAYGQTTVLSYLAAQKYIESTTGGCSVLASTLSIHGYGQGGYAAIAAAKGLQAINMKLLPIYVGSAPLDLITQLGFSISELLEKQHTEDTRIRFRIFLAFLGFGYSSNLPFLANANSEQTLLAEPWLSEIGDGLAAPNPVDRATLLSRVPFNPVLMINPDIRSLFEVRNELADEPITCHGFSHQYLFDLKGCSAAES
jgi:hypothetical protein